MFDIAQFLGMGQQPQPQAPNPVMPTNEARPADLATQWNAYLQDPNVRASMLSAGLAMMRPSWGGPGQQIVSGIGAGAETMGDRQAAQQVLDRQAEQDAIAASERADRKTDKALDRAKDLEIATMNNDTRMSLGNLRLTSGAGGAGRNTQLGYFKELSNRRDEMLKSLDPEIQKQGLDLTDDILFEKAGQMATADRANAGISVPGVAQNNGGTGGVQNSVAGGKAPQNTQKSPSQTNSPIRRSGTMNGKKVVLELQGGKWVPIQ